MAIVGSEPNFSSLEDTVILKKIIVLDKDEHEILIDYFIKCLQKCFQHRITSSCIFSCHENILSFHCSDVE